jgi:hypothetical protein
MFHFQDFGVGEEDGWTDCELAFPHHDTDNFYLILFSLAGPQTETSFAVCKLDSSIDFV